MCLWNLEFFPPAGKRNSPVDRLRSRDVSPQDQANIISKLKQLQKRRVEDWPHKWAKPIDDFKELVHGDFRVFHHLAGNTIVVCHMCRKVSKKAKKEDIGIAKENLKNYMSE